MDKNNKKWWFIDPEEHGGDANMFFYFAGIGMAFLAIIIYIIKKIVEYGI